ncbi:hypothetical protein S245_005204, partial [Arachis hypogaea]
SLIPRAVGFGGAILLCVALANFISDRRWTKKKPIMKKSRGVIALQIIQEIFSEKRGQWKAATQSRENIRSFQRYYSNTYLDGNKQKAIN